MCRRSFDPPPRVDSAVVRMVPTGHPPDGLQAPLESIVRIAFSQRRKLMRQTLGRWLEERGFGGRVRRAAARRGGAGGRVRGTGAGGRRA